jgi:hypothetical protein
MRRSDAFPSRYLSQDDVRAGPIRVTIKDVLMESVGQGREAEDRPILYFNESHIKPMVLGAKINWTTIEAAYGEDTETWVGKPLDLYHDPNVSFGGEVKGAIRIRIPGRPHAVQTGAPPASLAETPPETDILAFDEAVAAAEKAGMAKDVFLVSLRVSCPNGYKSSRDTAAARKIIQDAIDEANTIPF